MLALNFKIALRTFRKHPGFTLINIGGLAIGIASCMLLLLYVNYEWNYDKQFKEIDRIYFAKLNLNLGSDIVTLEATPNKLAPAASQEIPAIQYASRISDEEYKLFSYKQNRIKLTYNCVDASFLKIFDYSFLQGDPATALDQYVPLTHWLKTYDYKVSIGVWPYLMAAGISLTIAILTLSMQSFKVAKANPVDALKYE